MNRIASLFLVIMMVASFGSLGYAQDPPSKLNRGVINILTGFWELPSNVIKMSKNEGAMRGLTAGLAEGLCWGLYRTLVGVYEVATFPIPFPAGYSAITDPPTLLTAETLEKDDPAMRSDFRPLTSELEGTKGGK